jgi:hypothetical protein
MGHRRTTHFFAFTDEKHAKRPILLYTAVNHGSVSVFKDVQGQHHTGEQDRIQWKQWQIFPLDCII